MLDRHFSGFMSLKEIDRVRHFQVCASLCASKFTQMAVNVL